MNDLDFYLSRSLNVKSIGAIRLPIYSFVLMYFIKEQKHLTKTLLCQKTYYSNGLTVESVLSTRQYKIIYVDMTPPPLRH